MKYYLIIISIVLTTIGFSQNNVTDAKGRKQGVWIKYYPNSKVMEYKGEFKDNIPQGTFTYYYTNNKTKAIMKHENNAARTVSIMYYPNGKVLTYGIYLKSKKDSVWTTWNEEGRLLMKETYKNDLLNGEKRLYFIPSDKEFVKEVCINSTNYLNGEIEGPFKEYYPSGQLRKTGQYLNHKREGEWISYEMDGKKMAIERYYKGQKHGWFIGYNADGSEGEKRYFFYNKQLQGKELELNMKSQKEKGLNPNIGYN